MKWIQISADNFPDDWERKILRHISSKVALDNSSWEHIRDGFENEFSYIRLEYDQVEWLDESPDDLKAENERLKLKIAELERDIERRKHLDELESDPSNDFGVGF